MLFYKARYYDPNLARFVSSDSIGIERENPQTRNRYAYVLNNPLKYNDPSGHCATAEEIDACEANANEIESYGFIVRDLILFKAAWELGAILQAIKDFINAAGWTIDTFKAQITQAGTQWHIFRKDEDFAGTTEKKQLLLELLHLEIVHLGLEDLAKIHGNRLNEYLFMRRLMHGILPMMRHYQKR